MARDFSIDIHSDDIKTPVFIVFKQALQENLHILKKVQDEAGCKILLALKGFAMWSLFPQISEVLHGICASSPHEARLGREEFKREVHSYAAAFSESHLKELLEYSDHIIFNSFSQWEQHQLVIQPYKEKIEFGIRINPEHSEVDIPVYDPCGEKSRLGVTEKNFKDKPLDGIDGLHFHVLCEDNSLALERTLKQVEEKFGSHLNSMKWINFGGGHHITREDYDVDHLCNLIINFKERYNLEVYLEPGEAIALHTGILMSSVLDIIHNETDIAILDTSAAAHMPDVIEMPYRPEVLNGFTPDTYEHNYKLGGLSCLAGDVIGDYSFKEPLKVGDKISFLDMAHYTMVKTNTFNGIQLPSIAVYDEETKELTIVKEFGYENFKNRLS